MDLDQILAPGNSSASPASAPVAYSGKVSRLDGQGNAFVVVPALSLDFEHGPVNVTSGGTAPPEGTACLVVFDQASHPWIVGHTDPGEWLAPTFLGGWGYEATGLYNASFRKDSAGMVHLRGFVQATAPQPIYSVPFVLPEGYHPVGGCKEAMYGCAYGDQNGNGETTSGVSIDTLDGDIPGAVRIRRAADTGEWAALDSIRFLAA